MYVARGLVRTTTLGFPPESGSSTKLAEEILDGTSECHQCDEQGGRYWSTLRIGENVGVLRLFARQCGMPRVDAFCPLTR